MLRSLKYKRTVQEPGSKHTSAPHGEERRTKDGNVYQSMGYLGEQGQGTPSLRWSCAGYQARNPFGDVSLVQAEGQHVLAAMLSCKPSAQGGRYLQRMLGREVTAQLQARDRDAPAALAGALAALDQAFRNLHPFNGPVLEGVRIAVAYMDLEQQAVHTASNSGCRAVVGRSMPDGEVEVVADAGHDVPEASLAEGPEPEQATDALRFASVPLQQGADTIIVGSEGLWQELPGQKALLRLQHYFADAPEACGGNAAVHLTNFALHAVAARSRRQADPRMRSLSSVERLQSLWTGDKSGYKWGKRQPVRRRRGDVHGDLSAIVMRLDWQGSQPAASVPAARSYSSLTASLLPSAGSGSGARQAAASEAARRRWSLIRLHMVDFPRHSRRLTLQRWAEVSAAALRAQHAERAYRRQAAEALLRWNPASSAAIGAASRMGSLGAADHAARIGSLSSASLAQHWAATRRPMSVFAQTPAASGNGLSGQALSDEDEVSSEAPSGQPLVPTYSYGTRSCSSSASSSLSWQRTPSWQHMLQQQQQQQQGGLSRTVSRRQLFAPPPAPQQPQHQQQDEAGERLADELAGVRLGGNGGITAEKAPAQQEWQAYEQHKRLLPVPSPALLGKLPPT